MSQLEHKHPSFCTEKKGPQDMERCQANCNIKSELSSLPTSKCAIFVICSALQHLKSSSEIYFQQFDFSSATETGR